LGDVVFALARSGILAALPGRNPANPSERERRRFGSGAEIQFRALSLSGHRNQGIGRYEPDGAYARGIADLQVLANLVPQDAFLFGAKPSSIDAGIYGFIANIHFYAIDTPLRTFVASHPNLVRHCETLHAAMA